MILGDFHFSLKTLSPNSITRTTEYSWQEAERIGDLPNLQNLGISSDKIEIEGVFYPKLNVRIFSNSFERAAINSINNPLLQKTANFVLQQFGDEENSTYKNIDDVRRSSLCKIASNLVSDGGDILGKFVIASIKETQSYFDQNGEAQKIEFSLALKRAPGDGAVSTVQDANNVESIVTNIARNYLRW